MRCRPSLVLAFATLCACSGADSGQSKPDADADIDSASGVDSLVFNEVTAPTDVVPDTGVAWSCVTGREASCPCLSGNDCDSGYCVPTPDGYACTETCIESCPDGWGCASVSSAGTDVVLICVPRFTVLCRPCREHDDCAQLGDDRGRCLATGDDGAKYCGVACRADGDCPDGFGCDGEQCVPDSGACTCNLKAISDAAATDCTRTNEWGTCAGERTCGEAGLGACSAAEPAPEACNGVDDDCGGATDEDVADENCNLTNSLGTCVGTRKCVGGTWGECSGDVATVEVCDGLDNDCSGLADDGLPDLDGDHVMDACDLDDDGDGVADEVDNCPAIANREQDDCDGDDVGDACSPDDDGDGVGDSLDCDPCEPTRYPGALDSCNLRDDDCDELEDEDCRYRMSRWYGFGSGFVLEGRGADHVVKQAVGVVREYGKSVGQSYIISPPAGLEGKR